MPSHVTAPRALTAMLFLLPGAAQAADTLYPGSVTPIGLTGTTYTQNFDTLANSGATGTALPDGWQVFEGGSNGNASYAVGTGSSATGGAYSFGSAGSTDRALGSLGSGTLSPVYYGAFFTNALGSAINSLRISYAGEQWRAADATADGLTFQYSLNATAINNGSWTSVAALAFTPPNATTAGAIDGNLAANRTLLAATLSGLNIAGGQTFAIRWVDVDTTGADDGLGVDDFAITANPAAAPVPEPATWATMLAGLALAGAAVRRRRSEAVAA